MKNELIIPYGHSITVADFDNDGYLDITAAEMRLGENPSPRRLILLGDEKGHLTKQPVQQGIGLHGSILADLDGALDILGKPYAWDAPGLDIWLNEVTSK